MTPSHFHAPSSRSENPRSERSGSGGASSDRRLLALAHGQGLTAIRTTLLQIPSVGNGETAIVRASVTTTRGTFTGLADANPGNADLLAGGHLVALAETRAEVRALRKAVNATTDSELQDEYPHVSRDPRETLGPSDAQRRYLFQLLAKEGLEGALARDFVHHELGVVSLASASRSRIYTLIERLRHEHATARRPS